MARDETPPFSRGETFYNGGTIDSADLGGINLEGKEWVFKDDIRNTGFDVRVRVVRNMAAAALLPKRLVTFKNDAYYGRRVDGYATLTSVNAYPVDELLPAAGVPIYDLFYIVVGGPALVKTDIASSANNLINIGDTLVSLTAATSGATTSGRVAPQDLTGATAPLGKQVQNRLGVAMSAQTTGNTDNDVLLFIRF